MCHCMFRIGPPTSVLPARLQTRLRLTCGRRVLSGAHFLRWFSHLCSKTSSPHFTAACLCQQLRLHLPSFLLAPFCPAASSPLLLAVPMSVPGPFQVSQSSLVVRSRLFVYMCHMFMVLLLTVIHSPGHLVMSFISVGSLGWIRFQPDGRLSSSIPTSPACALC